VGLVRGPRRQGAEFSAKGQRTSDSCTIGATGSEVLEEQVPNQSAAEEVVVAVGGVVDQVHPPQGTQHPGQFRISVKQDVQPVIEDHAGVHCQGKPWRVFPAAQPTVCRHEQQPDGRDGDKREADEELLRILAGVPGVVAVPVVYPVVLTLSVGVRRLLAESHLDVPPAVAQIMSERPDQPSPEKIGNKG
jgi:hypothetical protein